MNAVQPWRWQRELAEAVVDPRELLAILGLPASLAEPAERAGRGRAPIDDSGVQATSGRTCECRKV